MLVTSVPPHPIPSHPIRIPNRPEPQLPYSHISQYFHPLRKKKKRIHAMPCHAMPCKVPGVHKERERDIHQAMPSHKRRLPSRKKNGPFLHLYIMWVRTRPKTRTPITGQKVVDLVRTTKTPHAHTDGTNTVRTGETETAQFTLTRAVLVQSKGGGVNASAVVRTGSVSPSLGI
ncbi:hypothetical protein VTJ04DRAFT_58 [Mycothermus thermophilus]|uniref:uncharacterized protein n=1 Tax=Humicola insolens TaxID=85995 RepID=UPI00374434C7